MNTLPWKPTKMPRVGAYRTAGVVRASKVYNTACAAFFSARREMLKNTPNLIGELSDRLSGARDALCRGDSASALNTSAAICTLLAVQY